MNNKTLGSQNSINDHNYNPQIDIQYLRGIAFHDYVGSRILWNINSFLPSLHLLHESIEKYLKVLWARDKSFLSQDDFTKKLQNLDHDIEKIFKKLNKEDKEYLTKKIGTHGHLKLYKLAGLRYGTDLPLVGYNDMNFFASENFIKEIRKLLGEKIGKNLLQDLESGLYSINYKKTKKRSEALKLILSLQRIGPTKKEKLDQKRKFEFLMRGLR